MLLLLLHRFLFSISHICSPFFVLVFFQHRFVISQNIHGVSVLCFCAKNTKTVWTVKNTKYRKYLRKFPVNDIEIWETLQNDAKNITSEEEEAEKRTIWSYARLQCKQMPLNDRMSLHQIFLGYQITLANCEYNKANRILQMQRLER